MVNGQIVTPGRIIHSLWASSSRGLSFEDAVLVGHGII